MKQTPPQWAIKQHLENSPNCEWLCTHSNLNNLGEVKTPPKTKAELLEWVKSLVPDKQDEMDGCDPSTDDRDIRWAIAYEKGYNACIDDILTRLNSNQSVGQNKL